MLLPVCALLAELASLALFASLVLINKTGALTTNFFLAPPGTLTISLGLFLKKLFHIDELCIAVAFDDTKLKKPGKKIKTAFYQKDPMSPPFYINLMFSLRFLQGSLLMPMYNKNDQPPRALPITFKEVPAVKKPGKRATDKEKTL